MELITQAEVVPADWDRLVAHSPDGWFWHTNAYLEMLGELGHARGASGVSFVIVENKQVVAVCPVMIEESEGQRRFNFGDQPTPFPALAHHLSTAGRERVIARYVEALAELAAEYSVESARVRIPALSEGRLRGGLPQANPLLRFGFTDLAYTTQLVDLRLSEKALWSEVRKGHRSDIRRAEVACSVVIWDRASITDAKYREYQELHRKDAGRVTRSQRSFDLMLSWIRAGHGVLLEASFEGHAIAFALLVLFGRGAYYGSGCRDPEHMDVPASHLLQWTGIKWLKASGFGYYDVGIQYFGSEWFCAATAKDLGISRFKRGFGGTLVPLQTGETYYTDQALRAAFEERLRTSLAKPEGLAAR
jgi:hypothetical protein